MLITPAYAQALGGDTNSMLVSLLPFVLIFVIMYFLILRPQQKRVKQHQEMVKNVRRGDTVVTSGGMIGKVWKVEAGEIVIVIYKDRDTKCRFTKSAILDVVREPAAGEGKGAAGTEEAQKA